MYKLKQGMWNNKILRKFDFYLLRKYNANILTAKSTGFTCVSFPTVVWLTFDSQQMKVMGHCILTVGLFPWLFLSFLMPFWQLFIDYKSHHYKDFDTNFRTFQVGTQCSLGGIMISIILSKHVKLEKNISKYLGSLNEIQALFK